MIEVKRYMADRAAISQLLEYMGTLDQSQTFMDWGRPEMRVHRMMGEVRGVVVAPEFTQRARRVLGALKNVTAYIPTIDGCSISANDPDCFLSDLLADIGDEERIEALSLMARPHIHEIVG